ncbi:hypothetical protein Q428_07315 [Fervidicella metallireducens AeB]|uniref:L,D-TPase catalytic domain-containing protein n=1 Tax=Fervidicella metallireducens AeB TaxID=1403537 RepID=A0A017RV01_9CLOT|nr:L,D-transpeptidase [Fervidicella metallireducens]EYE88563.1 hypothetical protein Q428_07315 [Fervidicella metallireducens AeB]
MYYCPLAKAFFLLRANYLIIVDTKERRLSLLINNKIIKSYKVGVGKPSTPTPKGRFKIINKVINPGGPFGARWMGLNVNGIGIHGTNSPESIGKYVSHGCIRMYNRDVIELFNKVPIGTPVVIN